MLRETKDRARPFSKKHRKYWLPVTGGMILIGVFNVVLGMCTYDPPPDEHTRIKLVIPPSTLGTGPAVPAVPTQVSPGPPLVDAGVSDAPRP